MTPKIKLLMWNMRTAKKYNVLSNDIYGNYAAQAAKIIIQQFEVKIHTGDVQRISFLLDCFHNMTVSFENVINQCQM